VIKQKKILPLFIVFVLVVAFVPTAMASANDRINVTIDGVPVNFPDQRPTIVDQRTLVPVRGVFEELGFNVAWNENLRQATLTREGDVVIIRVGSRIFTTNGENHNLEVPAQIVNGRTMLPIRAVLESVGYFVYWNPIERIVEITTEPTATVDDFALTISVEQTALPQGEDFIVGIELKNISGEDIEITYSILFRAHIPNFNFFGCGYGCPGGASCESLVVTTELPAPQTVSLPANGVIEENLWRIGSSGLPVGEHELSFDASFWIQGESFSIQSNMVILTVR